MDEFGNPLPMDEQVKQQMAMLGVTNFSWWGLLWALIFGIVGARFFMRARKKQNSSMMWTGVIMMVYPGFSTNPWYTGLGGLILTGFAIYFERYPEG